MKTGEIVIDLTTKLDKYVLYYELGQLKHMLIYSVDEKTSFTDCEPVRMDLTSLKINVDNFRVVAGLDTIFISSTNHSVGYIISWFSSTLFKKMRVRMLEEIGRAHV